MNDDESGLGVDLYFGTPDGPQPDWRKEDDENDSDDPEPVSSQVLIDMLGFDPDDFDE